MIPDIHNTDGETKEQKFAKAHEEMKNQFAPSELDTWITDKGRISNMEQSTAINQAKEEKRECVHRGLEESMTKKPTMMRDHLTEVLAECGTRREEAKGLHKFLKALNGCQTWFSSTNSEKNLPAPGVNAEKLLTPCHQSREADSSCSASLVMEAQQGGLEMLHNVLDCKGALLPHFPKLLMFSGDGRQEELIWRIVRTATAKMLSNSRSLANLEQDDETLTAMEESMWKQYLSCQKCGNQSEEPSTLEAHITMEQGATFQMIHDGKNLHQDRPDSQNGQDEKNEASKMSAEESPKDMIGMTHPQPNQKFSCIGCNAESNIGKNLKCHIARSQTENTRARLQFRTSLLGRPNKLSTPSVDEEEQDSLSCHKFDEKFATNQQMQQHKRAQPQRKIGELLATQDYQEVPAQTGFICEVCQKFFQNVKAFKWHPQRRNRVKRSFGKIRRMKPDAVRQIFKLHGKKSLKVGQVAQHGKICKARCDNCGKFFTWLRSFENSCGLSCHKQEAAKSYTYTICNQEFEKSSNLNGHLRVHTEDELHKCKYCPKTFQGRVKLNRHMNTHSRDGGNPAKAAARLKTYVRPHARPLQCRDCSEMFLKSSCLDHHKQVARGKNAEKSRFLYHSSNQEEAQKVTGALLLRWVRCWKECTCSLKNLWLRSTLLSISPGNRIFANLKKNFRSRPDLQKSWGVDNCPEHNEDESARQVPSPELDPKLSREFKHSPSPKLSPSMVFSAALVPASEWSASQGIICMDSGQCRQCGQSSSQPILRGDNPPELPRGQHSSQPVIQEDNPSSGHSSKGTVQYLPLLTELDMSVEQECNTLKKQKLLNVPEFRDDVASMQLRGDQLHTPSFDVIFQQDVHLEKRLQCVHLNMLVSSVSLWQQGVPCIERQEFP